jgi:tricorn protease-like protein
MRRPTVLPAVLAAALLFVACDHPAAPSIAAQASAIRDVGNHGPPGSMVFHSARSGDLEVYLMNPDGTNPVRFTNSPGEDNWPDISPNGRYVAFASTRTGNREIFVLDLSNGSLRNVSQNAGDDNWPRWSPNGKQIAFHSNRDGNYEIYVVDVTDRVHLAASPTMHCSTSGRTGHPMESISLSVVASMSSSSM